MFFLTSPVAKRDILKLVLNFKLYLILSSDKIENGNEKCFRDNNPDKEKKTAEVQQWVLNTARENVLIY